MHEPRAEQSVQQNNAFVKALDAQVRSCQRLLCLGTRKQEALAAWDLPAIEGILTAEREALARFGVAESSLARAAAEAAAAVGLEPIAGYGAIAFHFAEPQRSEAGGLFDQLTELTAQLAAVSECNTQLIRRAQSYVEFHLAQAGRAMGGAQGAPAYDHRGAVATAGMRPSAGRHY